MPTQRALILGATGQDGGYLVESLIARGYEVHGVVRNFGTESDNLSRAHPSITLHLGNLLDQKSLHSVIFKVKPIVIFNLAGLSSVFDSWREPIMAGESVGLGVARLLHTIEEYQREFDHSIRLIQASSSEVYGEFSGPVNENSSISPTSPYGASKAYADFLIKMYRKKGICCSSVILFNHESPRRSEKFVSRKISMTVAKISLSLESELVLGNLDSRRDWGWAPDFVEAMVKVFELGKTEDYVISTGVSHSILDFALTAFKVVGIENGLEYIRVDESLVRLQDSREQVGDSAKARKDLSWSPTKDFKNIVFEMVKNDLRILKEDSIKNNFRSGRMV